MRGREDRPFVMVRDDGHGVGGQGRGQKRLGRGGDDRGWQGKRRVVGLTAEEVGLTPAEGKELLGELARLVLQTQMEEFAVTADAPNYA